MRQMTKGIKLLRSERGVSLIEILVSLAILSMVVLYVYQGFYAANENARMASKVDYGKMIAETTKASILANPDLFIENMQLLKNNSNATIPDEKVRIYKYSKKNTILNMNDTIEGTVSENGTDYKTKTDSGTATLKNLTKKGLLSEATVEDHNRLECQISFKRVVKEQSIQLSSGQMTNHTSPNITVPADANEYTFILMDNEEEKLRTTAPIGGDTAIVASGYLYKNKSFSDIKNMEPLPLKNLENDFAVWARLYCWLELVEKRMLSDFMNSVIAVAPILKDDSLVQLAINNLKPYSVGYVEIQKSQVDSAFGAIPIVFNFNQAANKAAYKINVANLSSYHLDLFQKKSKKEIQIVGTIEDGSVGFVDLSQTEFKESSIELEITVTDVETGRILFKTKEVNPRYKIKL